MLEPYKVEFNDSEPPIEFSIGVKSNGNVFLKPNVGKESVKSFGYNFVKYGFSVGPHNKFGDDFSLGNKLMHSIILNIYSNEKDFISQNQTCFK